MNNRDISIRFFIIILIVMGCYLLVLRKAFVTIFVEGDHWKKKIAKYKVENKEIEAKRGNIFAADGRLMASSIPQYYVFMDFLADGLRKDTLMKYMPAICNNLSHHFGEMSPDGYRKHILNGYNKQSRNYKLIKRRISYTEMKDLKEMPFFNQSKNRSGLKLVEMAQRKKPFGELASRTIGDVYGDQEKGGKNGLELAYDSLLRGTPGVGTREKVGGKYMTVPKIEAVDGVDITTTIDVDIQDITHKALIDKLTEIDAESGTAIVMEVKTGAIKAISNLGRTSSGGYVETQNYAVADESEPGSTFKVASMMVALDKGIVKPDDMVDTGEGLYVYKGANMTDHNRDKGGYGQITAAQSIWYSSNIGVAKIILKGFEKNPSEFVDALYDIGLHKKLNLGIPGAGSPKIRHPKDSLANWYGTTLPWMSFGYETQIPPIYTLNFYNAIANNGKMMKPYFIKSISKNGNIIEKEYPQVVNSKICKKSTLKNIQEMLEGVVEHGTASMVNSEHVSIAGKTGTAQIAKGRKGYTAGGKSHQVSFCGYFPADKPLYSCIVVVRSPRRGYPSGGGMSGMVFKQIAEKTYAQSKIVPIEKNTDSTAVFVPDVKSGNYGNLIYVLRELGISHDYRHKEWEWATARLSQKEINMKEYSPSKELVPNVVGMGAKDAVYIMENCGLRVSLNGRGKVISQSVTSGSRIVKGSTIVLNLR